MKLNSTCLALILVLFILVGCSCCILIIGFELLQTNIIEPNVTIKTQTPVMNEQATFTVLPPSLTIQNTEAITSVEKH